MRDSHWLVNFLSKKVDILQTTNYQKTEKVHFLKRQQHLCFFFLSDDLTCRVFSWACDIIRFKSNVKSLRYILTPYLNFGIYMLFMILAQRMHCLPDKRFLSFKNMDDFKAFREQFKRNPYCTCGYLWNIPAIFRQIKLASINKKI